MRDECATPPALVNAKINWTTGVGPQGQRHRDQTTGTGTLAYDMMLEASAQCRIEKLGMDRTNADVCFLAEARAVGLGHRALHIDMIRRRRARDNMVPRKIHVLALFSNDLTRGTTRVCRDANRRGAPLHAIHCNL